MEDAIHSKIRGRTRRHSEEDSAPLLTAEPTTSGLSEKHKIFKWATILSLTLLLAGGALSAVLVATVFNICPHQHNTTISTVTCDNATSSPSHGTQCNLTCMAGYIPTGVTHSTCRWIGKWSSPQLTCTTPGVLVAGYSYQGQSAKSSVEIYPSSSRDQDYSALPAMIGGAVSGFLAGTPMVCGGLDLISGKFTADCRTLTKDNIWTNSTPLLKERYLASSAMVNNGRSFWILGGVDSTKYIQSSTMVLHDCNCGHTNWIEGPSMPSARVGHCSTNVHTSWRVMVTGGSNSTNSLSLVEVYDWKLDKWSTLTPLNQPRQGHSCAQVYTDHQGGVDLFATEHSILTVVVAGGYSILNSTVETPVTSVEMLVGDQWKILPHLPRLLHGLTMNLPTSLVWLPGSGLQLVGGCSMNYTSQRCWCSQLVWSLHSNVLEPQQKWVAKLGDNIDEMMMPGNTALLIPDNFLRSEKPDPTTTTEEPHQTPPTTQDESITTKNNTEINHLEKRESLQIYNMSLSENMTTYRVLPGPEFDNKWLVPIKMPMFMRRFMIMKAMPIDEDEDGDNNFGHFTNEDVFGNQSN